MRTQGEEGAAAAEVRATLQNLRRNLPYVNVEPLTSRIRPALRRYELGAMLFTLSSQSWPWWRAASLPGARPEWGQ